MLDESRGFTYQSEHPFHNGWQYVCHGPDSEILPHILPAVYVCHPDHDHNAMIHCLPLLKYMGADAETIYT